MKFISTKELRISLPRIRKHLAQGEEFLLIFQSKPIAKIIPLQEMVEMEEATDSEVEQAALRDLGDDFLSKKELKHYLALK